MVDLLSRCILVVATFTSMPPLSSGQACPSCQQDQFQCKNCRCILQSARCDHNNDCGDGSDETPDCSYPTCSGHEFTCANHACISQQWVCDGSEDCADGTDERNCDNYICHPNEWACPHSGRCIKLSQVCDGTNHCASGGDEGGQCANACTDVSCDNACQATPTEGLCYCKEGYQLSSHDNRTCVDFDECSTWNYCDHICVNAPGSFKCICENGYTPDADSVCRAKNSSSAQVIISSSTKIITVDRNGNNVKEVVLVDAVDVDVDVTNGTIYYINNTDSQVYSIALDGSGTASHIPFQGLAVPVDIAFDWLTKSIYLVDRDTARIELFNIPSGLQQNILSDNLQTPVALALDPNTGYLFFADRGQKGPSTKPRIERIFMDGSHRWNLGLNKMLYPQALTLDVISKRVFWVDSHLDHLEVVDYNGQNRRTIISGGLRIPAPVSVSTFENQLFFADITKLGVIRVNKTDVASDPQSLTQIYRMDAGIPTSVVLAHQSLQTLVYRGEGRS